MKIFEDIKSIRSELKKFPGKKTGFVPTMGALHEGHLSLIELAKNSCDIVVTSIFINQKQFNNNQDYLHYPNTLEKDVKYLESKKVDILFHPKIAEIYPQNFSTSVTVSGLTNNLCGSTRPGHFDGVALIVAKLFGIVKPDKAFFGEKDFQQLQVIRKLVRDLNIDVEIIPGKTVRENDGLAMSSRNLRLSENGRKLAPKIYENLLLAKKQITENPTNIDSILSSIGKNLLQAGIEKIDYLQACDEENLQPIKNLDSEIKSRLFIAAYIDGVRLIDNITLY
ncbi:MAG: pantoate/beta-alanine ligase [Rickettsiaceae bacterium]|jgi:pantoate--beta-alanine ligase|nr:pantoate/beta-alanine ligase [Rickettsiaceae bacterium]